jgi:hypothetical protein
VSPSLCGAAIPDKNAVEATFKGRKLHFLRFFQHDPLSEAGEN